MSAGGGIGDGAREAVDALQRHVVATIQHGSGVLAEATANVSEIWVR